MGLCQVFNIAEHPKDQSSEDAQGHRDQPIGLSGVLMGTLPAILQAVIPCCQQDVVRCGFITGDQCIAECHRLIVSPGKLVDFFQLLRVRFGCTNFSLEFHINVPFAQVGIEQQDGQWAELTPQDLKRVPQVETWQAVELHLKDEQHLVGVLFAKLERIKPQKPAVEDEQVVVH